MLFAWPVATKPITSSVRTENTKNKDILKIKITQRTKNIQIMSYTTLQIFSFYICKLCEEKQFF